MASYVCKDCGKQFQKINYFTSHKVIRDSKPLKCELCEAVLSGAKAYNNHKKIYEKFL